MKKIVFTVKDGKLNTNLDGFHGSDCFVEAQKVIEAIGKAGLVLECKEVKRKGAGEYEKETAKTYEKDTN